MSIVTLKNKSRATRNVKITNKINRNKNSCVGVEVQNRLKPMGYHSFNRRLKINFGSECCPNGSTNKQIVKPRVNQRLTNQQALLNKKISVLRRIACDNKTKNITKLSTKKRDYCKIVGKTNTVQTGKYTNSKGGRRRSRKDNVVKYCSVTKDLLLPGNGLISCRRITNLISDVVCDDKKNAKNAKCGVY